MRRFILGRLLQLIIVVFFVSIVIFIMMRLSPGDPAVMLVGRDAASNPELLETVRRQMGLDRSVVSQYFIWLGNFLKGDFGVSYRSGEKVIDLIREKLPVTLELTFAGLLIGAVISIPLGTLQAVNFRSRFDRSTYFFTLFVDIFTKS